MICPSCSKTIPDTTGFCIFCGTKVSNFHRRSAYDVTPQQMTSTPTPQQVPGRAMPQQVPGVAEPQQQAAKASPPQTPFGVNLKGVPHPNIGEILLGRYEIRKPLKRGGMGAIYEVHDRRLKKQWALKEMIEYFMNDDEKEKATERFEREATILASLNHPNLPRVVDYFEEKGRFYIVMDYIVGEDLTDIINNHKNAQLPEHLVIKISLDLLNILDYLHSLDPPVIYRDLKPSNIIIRTSDNCAVLVDFGIARALSSDGTTKTEIGTIGYAPPEQYAGYPVPVSDLYALGATMHQLLSGLPPRVPFQFQPVREINQAVSKNLEKLIMKALALEPENRWKSAREMITILEQIDSPSGPFLDIELTTKTPKHSIKKTPDDIPVTDTAKLYEQNISRPEVTPSQKKMVSLPGLDTSTLHDHIRLAEVPDYDEKTTSKLPGSNLGALNTEHLFKDSLTTPIKAIHTTPSLQTPDSQTIVPRANTPLAEKIPSKVTSMLSSEKENALIKLLEYEKKYKDKKVLKLHTDQIFSFVLHPQKEIIASASKDETIKVWDINSNREIMNLSQSGQNVQHIGFSSDGRNLVFNSGLKSIVLFDIKTKIKVREFNRVSSPITSISMHPLEPIIAIGANDGEIILWNYASQEFFRPKYYFKPVSNLCFSNNGAILASGHIDGTTMLWDVATKKQIRNNKIHESRISCLCFAPNNRILASGSVDGSVIIWNAQKLEPARTLRSNTGEIISLDFIKDHSYLCTSSEDNSIRLWDLQVGELNVIFEKNIRRVTKVAFVIYQDNVGLITQMSREVAPEISQTWKFYFFASTESGEIHFWKKYRR